MGLVLMGRAMLSKSLIQFSVDGWGSDHSLLFAWGQTMVEVMKTVVISFKRSHACTAALSPSKPEAGHHQTMPPPHVWVSLLWGHCSFLLGPDAYKVLFLPSKSLFPQTLCKLWQLYDGVNSDLLQEGLCHTQVYWTQSCCPCSRPLINQASTGDPQTQLCLSLCGVSGSWCTQGMFETSEHLWQVWGLILNMISSLLPSCEASPLPFSFAPELTILLGLSCS